MSARQPAGFSAKHAQHARPGRKTLMPINSPPICRRRKWSRGRNHLLVRQQPRSLQMRWQIANQRPRGKVGRKHRPNQHATIAAADARAKGRWARPHLCQRTNHPTTVPMGETAPYLVLAGASLQVDPVGELQWDTKDARGAKDARDAKDARGGRGERRRGAAHGGGG